MKTESRIEYVTRDGILKLLTDDEIARVSTAETAGQLSEGDEYLDLAKIDQGVRRAHGAPAPTGNLLPRKSVSADTWSQIVAQLAAHPHVPATAQKSS